jgi:catechol 2,3-dioxygenase-like lactoylglutathione lyase family enzyme
MTTDDSNRPPAVRQLRLVVEAEDYEAAVEFFRDALGLPEQAAFSGEGDARVVILDAGRATLEIANPAQKRMIDEVEVGRQVAPTAGPPPAAWSPPAPPRSPRRR